MISIDGDSFSITEGGLGCRAEKPEWIEVREGMGCRERAALKRDVDRDGCNREGLWGCPSEMLDERPPGDFDRGREWGEVGRGEGRVCASR